ncbi:uncharacterized protein [Lolium perenne]|uniref:uncharacterized protein n=1 Tax=Lolium perenne TaxID=4522 RepID=UPI0021F57658|nr:uncharacterized protein LOC127304181 [Lolium perenne]
MATTNTKTMSMKLLVDTKAQRVLLAEASKDVVDFLFSLLALPLGAAVKLLRKDPSMFGSVGDIYASFETLDAAYVAPGASKDALLAPSPAVGAGASSILGLPEPAVFFFECQHECRGKDGNYLTDMPGVKCPGCGKEMQAKSRFVTTPAQQRKFFKPRPWLCDDRMVTDVSGVPCPCRYACGQKMEDQCQYVPHPQPQAVVPGVGFVQGIVRYTVTDSLAVAPMSSSVALLSTFAALDLSAIQEKTVQLGHAEGLEILRASLQSRTVLTDVFLGKEEPRDTA